jgi:hypothetical protein
MLRVGEIPARGAAQPCSMNPLVPYRVLLAEGAMSVFLFPIVQTVTDSNMLV